ncbi:MAG: hypothetical protein PHW34_13040 [Hespellia sp.]|nr:hypothetical protein [Hespellia sp.]
MNQIICYIYEYKGTSKIQNSGFLKISSRGHTLLVQMHIKGLALTNSEFLSLSIFYKNGDLAIIKNLLTLPVKNKSINMQFSVKNDFFPERKHLQECDGFLFSGPYGETYVATWTNVPFDTGKIQTVPTEVRPKETTPEKITSEGAGSEEIDSKEALSEKACSGEIATVEAESQAPSLETPVQTLPVCRKISRSEMSVLPRRSWNLANNSFLLHGFHNFHHLLLVESDDAFILGVPGFYDKKEARAADLFGFPLFSVDYISELALSDDEKSDRDNFGYWCRTISKIKEPSSGTK